MREHTRNSAITNGRSTVAILALVAAPFVAAAAVLAQSAAAPAPASAALAPAASVAAGPVAANSNPTNCRDSGGAKVCGRAGHSSLHAEPTVRMPQGQLFSNAWLPGYGRGHLPPLIALD